MTADLTPTQAARLEAIEAAPWAEEARRLFMAARADHNHLYAERKIAAALAEAYRTGHVAAIDVMRGAADDGKGA